MTSGTRCGLSWEENHRSEKTLTEKSIVEEGVQVTIVVNRDRVGKLLQSYLCDRKTIDESVTSEY